MLLLPKKYENSQLKNCLNKACEINVLAENKEQQIGQLQFATIQGFKGLDSKVVILVDMDKIYGYNFSRYVYTAISRARTKLYVMMNEKLYNDKILAI